MMQQQFQQYPQVQSGLKGRIVTSVDEVRATPIDMDGSETYFPHPASNSIYSKSIDMNGNAVIKHYVLESTKNGNDDMIALQNLVAEKATLLDNLQNKVSELEELLTKPTKKSTSGGKAA